MTPTTQLADLLEQFSSDQVSSDCQVMKGYRDGTHRMVSPEQTLRRLSPLLRAAGITRIANVTGLDYVGIPVVMVCRPNSRSLAVSQGKGLTLSAAKASGVMEAMELHHAEHMLLPLRLGSIEELRLRHHVVDITRLPQVTSSHFHPHLPVLWIEGFDLLQMESVMVPYEMVHMNACLPEPTGSGCFVATSNGLASGNHFIEAINHALCEIIERDATTLWYLLDLRARQETRIDLNSIQNADCRRLLHLYSNAGMIVILWETTSNIGVPSFLCIVMECTTDRSRLVYSGTGMGCHPNRDIAIIRALTEAAQSRLTLIAGSRDDVFREEYRAGDNHAVVEHLLALQSTHEGRRSVDDVPTQNNLHLEEDLLYVLSRLRRAGIDNTIFTDLSDPAFGVPVVRVIIPGLEGSHTVAGYVPGQRARTYRATQQ